MFLAVLILFRLRGEGGYLGLFFVGEGEGVRGGTDRSLS